MKQLLKKAYYKLPFKDSIYKLLKTVYHPSEAIAGYLKFKGSFTLSLGSKKLLLFNNNSTLASLLFWKGTEGYEKGSIYVWRKLSKNSQVVFDVGANFGLFGLIAKTLNSSSQIHFFEPLTRNCRLIEKNSELNMFEEITINEVAVSNFNGTATFYDMDEAENTIGSFKADFVESHSHHKKLVPIDVEVLSLDSYIQKKNLERIDLVKIDVEGVDGEVIDGFKNSIKRFNPDILIEITNEETGAKVQNLFQEMNVSYRFYEIDEDSQLIEKQKIGKNKGANYLITNKSLSIK